MQEDGEKKTVTIVKKIKVLYTNMFKTDKEVDFLWRID